MFTSEPKWQSKSTLKVERKLLGLLLTRHFEILEKQGKHGDRSVVISVKRIPLSWIEVIWAILSFDTTKPKAK